MVAKSDRGNLVRKHGKATIALCAALAVACCAPLAAPGDALALKTYTQSGYAMAELDTSTCTVLDNKNYGQLSYTFQGCGLESTPHYLHTIKGNHKATMTTWAYLPKSHDGSGDMGNPQSVAITPNGRYAYITYAATDELRSKFGLSEGTGRIVRYDLKGLDKLGVDSGDMTDFALASRHYRNGYTLTGREKQLMDCVSFGPWFDMGHGSALAYNSKDKHLWFSERGKGSNAVIERVSVKTLKPDLRIKFKIKKGGIIGNNLTFDKRGYCYYYSYSGGGWAPKGSIKISRGKIGKKSVRFEQYPQAIRHSPSKNIQSIGYNPANDRLYLVSNGTTVTVPVKKLGKLKNSDVLVSMFDGRREFEGLAFDSSGRGFLLVNKEPELMRASEGF